MKDARFIELVNLYIDRQISAEETAELELEIQSNPARRRTYQQYCRMHRATTLVYESFRAHAEAPATSVAQPGSIAYFAQRRQRARRTFWGVSVAGMAAAACAVLVLAHHAGLTPGSGAPTVAVKTATPAAVASTVAAAPVTAVTRTDYASLLATAHRTDAATFVLNQPSQVQPVSLFDDGVFNLQPGSLKVVPAKNGKTADQPTVAFQFQR